MLQSPSDEWQVYTVVCNYLQHNHADLEPQEVENMMSAVRYRWISYRQMQEVVANEAVPRSLIIDALMARLQTYESGVVLKGNNIPQNLRKRPVCGALIEYTSPEPTLEEASPIQSPSASSAEQAPGILPNGIIHWLATTFGRSTWKSPVSLGTMAVFSSSLERGTIVSILDEAPSELWTQNVPASYVSIDFMRYRVNPTSYALRHGGAHKRDYLRNWDFQGSNDGKMWTTLRRHSNDDGLNGQFGVKVFSLLMPPAVPYQYFRIIQTGHNSSGNNFLVLCGFEVFGELWDTPSSDEMVAAMQATLSSSAGPALASGTIPYNQPSPLSMSQQLAAVHASQASQQQPQSLSSSSSSP